tara:strand:+ start:477 stop:728 length:252 start_codon:yes stop_codon:yes gene_type:complete
MPKIIYNGVLRDMTPEEEVEYNKAVEANTLLEAEREKVKYKEDRRIGYPDIGDQLDDLFKQGLFSKEMSDKLQQVKTDNPKPE